MNKPNNLNKLRWLGYILISLIFGAIDYFFLDPIIRPNLILALAVWLIPLIPIAIHEIKVSGSKLKTPLACITSWILAVIAYYMCYAITLLDDNQVISFSWNDIFIDIAIWVVVAIIGGGIAGLSLAIIYQHIFDKNRKKNT